MTVTYRRGTVEDSFTAFQLFQASLLDLGERIGSIGFAGQDYEEMLEASWNDRRSLYEHLAHTAEHFWLAEIDGQAIGYARSILRANTRELTEFFVLPGQQSGGVGRELLGRAFPREGADHRIIIATVDTRALALYLKSGVSPRFPACYFGLPDGIEPEEVESDLEFQPVNASPETLADLQKVDMAIIGHHRDIDHAWLLDDRQGFVYTRKGETVGYGYTGHRTGPFALLNDADFPAVISHAARITRKFDLEFGLEVPLINKAAVDYLLANGYRMDNFFEFFMCDVPFGKFENYIFTNPPLFL